MTAVVCVNIQGPIQDYYLNICVDRDVMKKVSYSEETETNHDVGVKS